MGIGAISRLNLISKAVLQDGGPTAEKKKAEDSRPLSGTFIAPPCAAACEMTETEKHVYQLAITTPGAQTSSLEPPEVNLSSIIICVKVISTEHITAYFDGSTLLASESFLQGKSDENIQTAIREAIIAHLWEQYQETKETDDPNLKDDLIMSCYSLFNAGFIDIYLSLIMDLLSFDLTENDREFFEAQVFTSDAETIKQAILSKNLELIDRYLALYNEIKGKPKDSQLIARRQLEAAGSILRTLAIYTDTPINDLDTKAIEYLSTKQPELYQKALRLASNKNNEQILKVCCDLQSQPPLDLKAFLEGQFLVKIIWLKHFNKASFSSFQTDIFFNENKDFHPILKPIYLLQLDYQSHPDAIIRASSYKALNEYLSASLIPSLRSLPKDEQNKLRAQTLFSLNRCFLAGIIELKDLEYWKLRLSWPNMPEKELDLLYQVTQSQEYKENNTSKQLDGIGLKAYSADFKQALSYLLITDPENQPTNVLIQNIRQLSSLKLEYEETLDKAYEAFQAGKKDQFDKLWEKAGIISKKAESLRLAVLMQLANHYQSWQNYFINDDDITALGLGHLFVTVKNQKPEDLSTLAKDYVKIATKNKIAGKTTDTRKTLRDLVIDDYRMGEYAQSSLFSISWNLHARLEKVKAILTPKRLDAIKTYAQKYNIDANLLAAIIICEQRDQTNLENSTDLLGGIMGYNTSIGLGQMSIATARSLFPDLFRNASDLEVTNKLFDEGFNIGATAKYIQKLQEDGKNSLKRKPTIAEIGSRYTSTLYDSQHPWGKFVEMTYYELSISGMIDGSPSTSHYVEYRASLNSNEVSQLSFIEGVKSRQTGLEQNIPKSSQFYKYWGKVLKELLGVKIEDLPLSDQICNSKLLTEFDYFLGYYIYTKTLLNDLQSQLDQLIPYETIDPSVGPLINQYLYAISELSKCEKSFLDNNSGTGVAAYLQISSYYFYTILPEFEKFRPNL